MKRFDLRSSCVRAPRRAAPRRPTDVARYVVGVDVLDAQRLELQVEQRRHCFLAVLLDVGNRARLHVVELRRLRQSQQ